MLHAAANPPQMSGPDDDDGRVERDQMRRSSAKLSSGSLCFLLRDSHVGRARSGEGERE